MEDAVFVSDGGLHEIVVAELDSFRDYKGLGGGVHELEATVL